MSVIAGGSIDVTLKTPAPKDQLDLIRNVATVYTDGKTLEIEFEGNWWLETIIELIEPINDYIESGKITYWSDEGDAKATFVDGYWNEEWQQTYYESNLPNADISSTKRVSEILNAVTDDYACYAGIADARALFERVKMTEEEFKLYGLEWLMPEGE